MRQSFSAAAVLWRCGLPSPAKSPGAPGRRGSPASVRSDAEALARTISLMVKQSCSRNRGFVNRSECGIAIRGDGIDNHGGADAGFFGVRSAGRAESGLSLVSVVLSTYNWSSALHCALRSVQLQTLRDIEVLVIGDGCTDDSERIVESFGDSRFKWHNLPRNHGSQFAPNNRGLELASAAWVAYLGQDDIWHPRHLEACLDTGARTGADFVASICVM